MRGVLEEEMEHNQDKHWQERGRQLPNTSLCSWVARQIRSYKLKEAGKLIYRAPSEVL